MQPVKRKAELDSMAGDSAIQKRLRIDANPLNDIGVEHILTRIDALTVHQGLRDEVKSKGCSDLLALCQPDIFEKLELWSKSRSIGMAQEIVSDLETVWMAQQNQSLTIVASHSGQMKATEDAWLVPFAGTAHELLREQIESMSKNKDQKSYYSHILPILQSSGMGKSRTVDELAKSIFTIPICLRKSGDSGYPYGDKDLVSAFQHASSKEYNEESIPRAYYGAIFTCIFRAICEELKRSPYSSPSEWRLRLQEEDSDGKVLRKRLYAEACKAYDLHCSSQQQELGLDTMRVAFMELGNYIRRKTKTNVKVIIFIDECQFLTEKVVIKNDSRQRKPLDFVSYALEECRLEGLFGIFLSTNSILSQVSVPSHVFPSAREIDAGRNSRPPPFVSLDFDVWNGKFIVTEGETTLQEVTKLPTLARFGRPLWWTRITTQSGSINNDMLQELVDFAAKKLLGSKSAEVLSNPEAALAVLSSRLCIELEPRRESAGDIGEKLVANHLRVIYEIPDHKSHMYSGWPSEPILAEAAASIWNNSARLDNMSKPFYPLQALNTIIERCLLAKGERGELVARYLFLQAQDEAILSLRPDVHANDRIRDLQAPYSEAVPLWEFFQSLFKDNDILKSDVTPRNRWNGQKLKEACENKYVRFNHFARAGDSSIISTAAAWMALARGNAWQCYAGQEAINIIIPVFMKNEGSKLCRENVTFILCQVKNTAKPKTVHFSAETLKLFADGQEHPQDTCYFVIVLNFGGKDLKPGMAYRKAPPKHQDDPQFDGYPCYWFEVKGVETVSSEDKQTLENLLITSTYLQEARMKQVENTQMRKPTFGAWKSSFMWANGAKADSDGMDADYAGPAI